MKKSRINRLATKNAENTIGGKECLLHRPKKRGILSSDSTTRVFTRDSHKAVNPVPSFRDCPSRHFGIFPFRPFPLLPTSQSGAEKDY